MKVGLTGADPGPDGGLGYNPRCLKRDVGPYPSELWCNYTRIYSKNALKLESSTTNASFHRFDDCSKDHQGLSNRLRGSAWNY